MILCITKLAPVPKGIEAGWVFRYGGKGLLQRFVASPDNEVLNDVHVEGDDGVLAFVGLQEGQGDAPCRLRTGSRPASCTPG